MRALHTTYPTVVESWLLFSWLLQHSVRPSYDDLDELCKHLDAADGSSLEEWLSRWCLHTVISATNPFIPGVTLSMVLSEGIERASEGRQRILSSVRERVEDLLLEVLERLPKTARGFREGMEVCSAMFEPEGLTHDPRYLPGPLTVALQKSRQMGVFCVAPLVMDFLSLVFKKGLPELRDANNLRGNDEELRYLCENGHASLVVYAVSLYDERPASLSSRAGSFLQGTSRCGDMTILPGAQFIAAGVVANPRGYYQVPAMRMVLDFLVYVGMLVFFCTFVLLFEDGESIDVEGAIIYEDVAITWAEIVFAVYVLVSRVPTHIPSISGYLFLIVLGDTTPSKFSFTP